MFILTSPILTVVSVLSITFFYALQIPAERIDLTKKLCLLASFGALFVGILMGLSFDKAAVGYQNTAEFSYVAEYNSAFTIGADGLSYVFLMLTLLIFPFLFLAAWNVTKFPKHFFCHLLAMELLLVLTFVTIDLFYFFVLFESLLIPMFILIGVWGARTRKIKAAYYFFLYTLFGSLFMLFGMIYLYQLTGSLNYYILLSEKLDLTTQKFLWLCFFLAFAVKMPLFPFHIWLPEAHVEAPTVGSMLLASLLLKLGGYGLLRFSLTFLGEASVFFTPAVATLSIAGVVYGSLATMRQIDLKRVIAYSSVAHMNLVALGIFSFNRVGIEGAIYLMVAHGVVSAALFFCVGVIYDRTHTRLLRYYGGLVTVMPLFVSFFFLFNLANMGFPGTPNFIGEVLMLAGIYELSPSVVFPAALGIVFSAAYSTQLFARTSYGTLKTTFITSFTDLGRRENSILLSFTVLALLLGVRADFLMAYLEGVVWTTSSNNTLEITQFIFTRALFASSQTTYVPVVSASQQVACSTNPSMITTKRSTKANFLKSKSTSNLKFVPSKKPRPTLEVDPSRSKRLRALRRIRFTLSFSRRRTCAFARSSFADLAVASTQKRLKVAHCTALRRLYTPFFKPAKTLRRCGGRPFLRCKYRAKAAHTAQLSSIAASIGPQSYPRKHIRRLRRYFKRVTRWSSNRARLFTSASIYSRSFAPRLRPVLSPCLPVFKNYTRGGRGLTRQLRSIRISTTNISKNSAGEAARRLQAFSVAEDKIYNKRSPGIIRRDEERAFRNTLGWLERKAWWRQKRAAKKAARRAQWRARWRRPKAILQKYSHKRSKRPMTSNVLRRIVLTRLRWKRPYAARPIVTRHYRWYFRKGKRRLVRWKKNFFLRRRRQGKRYYAGKFGHKRWRTERKDRLFIKRTRRSYPLQRAIVHRTVATTLGSRVLFKRWRASVHKLPVRSIDTGTAGRNQSYLLIAKPVRDVAAPAQCSSYRKIRAPLSFSYLGARTTSDNLYRSFLIIRRRASIANRLRRLYTMRPSLLGVRKPTRKTARKVLNKMAQNRVTELLYQRQLATSSFKAARVPRARKEFTSGARKLSALSKSRRNFVFSKRTQLRLSSAADLQLARTTVDGLHPSGARFLRPSRLLPRSLSWLRSTFLRKSNKVASLLPTDSKVAIGAFSALMQQRRRYKELRFYRRNLGIRLPNTMMTRSRRRKGGHVLFARNTLKRPQTLRGLRNLLLPPAVAYAAATRRCAIARTQPAQAGFLPTVPSEDDHPQFWRRPHTRANIKAINSLRRRQYSKYKRQYKRQQLLRFKRRSFRSLADRGAKMLRTSTSTVAAVSVLSQELLARAAISTRLRSRFEQVRSSSFFRRTVRRLTPAVSRTVQHEILTARKVAPSLGKLNGLWQLRSVNNMRKEERALSAWSPQLSNRNRRAHFPRIKGVPVPRKWLSFRAKRARRQLNAKLLARNLPQRRYIDYAPVKLQYYYGSACGTGYARFRRVHRAKSTHNRWWRPNKFAAPFAHPFSRRALNSKRYARASFVQATAPKVKGFTRLLRNSRAVYLHSKFPPRVIPWRNFRYRRPRFGRTPKVLQRWTFVKRSGKTGRVSPNNSALILHRSAREIRALERYNFQHNVWKERRWAFLDTVTGESTEKSWLLSAIRSIPTAVWVSLRRYAGSPAVYARLQQQILEKFRLWARKGQQTISYSNEFTLTQARLFLINLITSLLKSGLQLASNTTYRGVWHAALRRQAFNARVNLKAVHFLSLRTLPQLNTQASSTNILQRERSGLYRRWLQGVEGTMKRSRAGYIPTSRSRYTANVALLFGRRRARFPASGRRRKSFDSLLHAFSKKVGPAHLRRAAALRFIRATPTLAYDFRENLLTIAANCGLNRRRRLARELSSLGYLSVAWRELLARRNSLFGTQQQYSKPRSKRRFLALPLARVNSVHANTATAIASPYKQQMRVIRAGILRRALRRRREERSFVDLRHSILQRKLPKEQASRPWKLRRAKKRRSAAKIGPYSHFAVNKQAPVLGRWSLVHLSAVGSQREHLALTSLPSVLPSGERLTRVLGKLRKDRRALRGFMLGVNLPKRRKLRRKNRDSRKRRRISRRFRRSARLAVIRNTKHWSEKKDRDLRVAAFLHKRLRYAKKLTSSLRRKSKSRDNGSALKARPSARSIASRLAQFISRERQLNVVGTHDRQRTSLPVARKLVAQTSLHRRFVTKRLGDARFKLLHRRTNLLSSWRARKRLMTIAKIDAAAAHGQLVSTRLLTSVDTVAPVTPLWFQKTATRVVKSQIRKENDALAEIAAKEDRYKLTAQYVESLTAFIPELMNYLLSRKIRNSAQRITYKTAKHLVRNIYWSLRVYLNVDPFDYRFIVRDKTPAARLRLFESISDLSESQITEQPQRASLRYRFQPGKVLRAPNTMRFRGDWLRAFFPAKHALYQENPEDYGKFLFKTRRIRRLRIGPKGIATWITEKQRVSHETRARQLLTLRFSRTRRRFETILQTTRRLPQVEGTTSLSSTARTSFFTRSASTYTGRGLVLATRWLHRQKRFIALEDGWRAVSPLTALLARNRTLPMIESRGRTNYVATTWAGISNTLLDPRFVRAKSARSRQYIIRSSRRFAKLTKQNRRMNTIFYRKVLSKKSPINIAPTRRWTRNVRRARGFILDTGSRQQRVLLNAFRATYGARRGQTARVLLGQIFSKKARLPSSRESAVTYPRTRMLPATAFTAQRPFRQLRLATRQLQIYKERSLRRVNTYRNKVGRLKLRRTVRFHRWAAHLGQGERPHMLSIRQGPLYRGFPRLLTRRQRLPGYGVRHCLYPTWGLKRRLEAGSYDLRTRYYLIRNTRMRFGLREAAQAVGHNPLLAERRAFSASKTFLRARRRLFYARVARSNNVGSRTHFFISPRLARLQESLDRGNNQRLTVDSQKLYRLKITPVRRSQLKPRIYNRPFRNWLIARLRRWEAVRFSRTLNRFVRGAVARTRLYRNHYKTLTLPKKLLQRTVTSASVAALRRRRASLGYFKNTVGRALVRNTALTETCALYTKFYQQTPFETHRPRLWNNLTQRWMKKYRIGRYWLRDTIRWLRDPWLSEIVACDVSRRPDRFGGQLRSRPQQVGEYVPDVDSTGRNVRRKSAPRERHKFQKVLPKVNDPEIKKTNTILKQRPITDRLLARQRLKIAKQALRKPMPTMRLANYEYRDVIREHKANKAKPIKQRQEEEQQQVKAYWERKAKKLPPLRPKRLPLKHPANLWLPHVIWKEIQRRIRKFEWRESDEVFFRKGFRNAFRFHPNERRKSPWLEHLMYTRATYSTRLREFRRRQYPHEQKKYKWLQRVRKMLYPGRGTRYIKWRKWPQLRRYNQKLHYTLFNFRDRGAARRHFKRLRGRTRPSVSAFVSMSKGLTDRLDLTCFQMGVAPSIYWARIVTEFGLLRVNGVTVYDPAYRITPSDIIYPNWNTIARFQHYFRPQLRAREEYQRRNRASTAAYPTNMEYHRGIRAFIYKHAPDALDFRKSARIRPAYFRWFQLDSAM